jgi:predicted nucleotidyltransferase
MGAPIYYKKMKNKLTKKEIVNFLKSEKTFLNNQFGVLNIGLFGSYAKAEQDIDSDIDFVVELKEPSFDYLAGLQIYLENKFNRKIELVRKGGNINLRFFSRIKDEVIYA